MKDNSIPNCCLDKGLTLIGNASWHIFLVQSTYYALLKHALFSGNGGVFTIFVNLGINLIICVGIGVLFFLLENKLVKMLKR